MEHKLTRIFRRYGDILAFSYYLTKGLVSYIVERLSESGVRSDWFLSTVGVFIDCHQHLQIDIVHYESWLVIYKDECDVYLYDNISQLVGHDSYESALLAIQHGASKWMKRFIINGNLSSSAQSRIFDTIWSKQNREFLQALSEIPSPGRLPPRVQEMARIISEWGRRRE